MHVFLALSVNAALLWAGSNSVSVAVAIFGAVAIVVAVLVLLSLFSSLRVCVRARALSVLGALVTCAMHHASLPCTIGSPLHSCP